MERRQTTTSTLFRRGAEELVVRLSGDDAPEAKGLLVEARDLMAIFAGWERERPADDVRVARIEQLFALNKRVLDWFASPHASSPPPSRRYEP